MDEERAFGIYTALLPNKIFELVDFYQGPIQDMISRSTNKEIFFAKNFPEDKYFYVSIINTIVGLSEASPADSIKSLLSFLPFGDYHRLFDQFLEKFSEKNTKNKTFKAMIEIYACGIFADIVVQILSGFRENSGENKLYDSLFETAFLVLGMKFDQVDQKFYAFINEQWLKIVKKFAVIVSLLGIIEPNKCYSIYKDKLGQINSPNIQLYGILFCYIRLKDKKQIMDAISDYLKIVYLLISRKKQYITETINGIRNLILQLDNVADLLNNKDFVNLLKMEGKSVEYKYALREIKAIIMCKKGGLTIEKVRDFMQKVFDSNKMKDQCKLRCFLHILRGGRFDPETLFWKFGNNRRKNISYQCSLIWNIENTDDFVKIYMSYMDKIQINHKTIPIISDILFNFASRKENSFSDVIRVYNISNDLYSVLPILITLMNMIDPKVDFMHYSSINAQYKIEQKEVFLKQLKNNIHTSLMLIKPTLISLFDSINFEPSKLAYSPAPLQESKCPEKLTPIFTMKGDNFASQISMLTINQDKQIREKLSSFNISYEYFSMNISNNLINEPSVTDRALMYIICLLIEIASESEIQSIFIPKLILGSYSKSESLALFSLYVFQFLYLKKDKYCVPIIDIIINTIYQLTSGENVFTLLCLLHNLLILPNPTFSPENVLVFTSLSNKIQAVLLFSLSFPFLEIRKIALHIFRRLEILHEQCEIKTIYNQVELHKNTIFLRIKDNIGMQNLPYIAIGEICCSSLNLFNSLYSEILKLLSQEQFNEVCKILSKINLDCFKYIPSQSENINNFKLLLWLNLSVMHCTLNFIPSDRLKMMKDELPKLTNPNFLTYYNGLKIITIPNKTDNEIQFIHKNIVPVLDIYLFKEIKDFTWVEKFLFSFIRCISIPSVVITIEFLIKRIKSLNEQQLSKIKILQVLIQVSKIILFVISTSDFQLTLTYSSRIANGIKTILSTIEIYVSQQPDKQKNIGLFEDLKSILLQSYVRIVKNFCSLSNSKFYPKNVGPFHCKKQLICFLKSTYTIEQRQQTLSFLLKVSQKDEKFMAKDAILELITFAPIFDQKVSLTKDLQELALNSNRLNDILQNHLFLFDSFIKEAFMGNRLYFKAICSLYIDETDSKEIKSQKEMIISEEYKAVNLDAFKKRGFLLMIAFFYLTSEQELRSLAFELICRLCCVFTSLVEPNDLTSIAILNNLFSANRKDFKSKSFSPTQESITSLIQPIAMNLPFITDKLFDVLIWSINNLNSGEIEKILIISSIIGRYIDITKRSVSTISRFLFSFEKLSITNQSLFGGFFVELSKNKNNFDYLLNSLMFYSEQFNHTCHTILFFLSREYPSIFILKLIQPMHFSYWVNFILKSIIKNENFNISNSSTFCSLSVIDDLINSQFSSVIPFLHIILHYCLIYSDQTNLPHYPLIKKIIIHSSEKLGLNVKFDENSIFTFKESTFANKISVPDLANKLSLSLQKISSELIDKWSNIALQWLTQCGDLNLATKSGLILSSIPLHFYGMEISSIMHSLNAIIPNKYLQQSSQVVSEYTNVSILCIQKYVQTKDIANIIRYKLGNFIFQFTFPFLNFYSYNKEASRIALDIICILIPFTSIHSELNISKYFKVITRMLSLKMNPLSSMKLLGLVAKHFTDKEIKIQAICLLLPILYASLNAYYMLDPYASSIDEEILSYSIFLGKELGKVDFGEQSKINNIFENTFNNLGTIQPNYFLDKISNELCCNYQDIVFKCGGLYTEMLYDEVEVTFTSIFSILISFLKFSNHDKIIKSYNDVIRFACKKQTEHSCNLLFVIGTYSHKKENDINNIAPLFEGKEEIVPFSDLLSEIDLVVKTLPSQAIAQGEVNLENDGSIIPIYPLLNNAFRDSEENKQLILQLVIQPYASEKEQWKNINDIEEHDSDIINENQDPFSFYSHSTINNLKSLYKKDESSMELFNEFPPDYFIIHSNEYNLYQKRVEFNN